MAAFLRVLACALVVLAAPLVAARPGLAADAVVNVDVSSPLGFVGTSWSTQLVFPGVIEGTPGAAARLADLGAPLVRLHVGSDGCCWAGGPAPALPGSVTRGSWDFSSLDAMIAKVRAYGAAPVMNPRYAPPWMWTCSTFGGAGTVRDATFGEFAAYMARLVAYYNTGRMTAENGTVLVNPAGVANRMTWWEIWNEPDLSNETPCHPANWGPALTPAEYVTMWNAVVPAMLAVDPSIKLVGPATAAAISGMNPDYVPALMSGAGHKPDAVSFHGYGGWDNAQSDGFLFDGDAGCPECGLRGIASGLAQVRAWAGNRPVWVTEMNVNAAYGDDPARRPWSGYGAAWGASAFRAMVLGGAALVHQYQFVESKQFGLLDPTSGAPLLPYWRDYHLNRAFPLGTQVVSATSTASGIEVLAGLRPGGHLSVLVVNRQIANPAGISGAGVAASVQLNVAGASIAAAQLRMLDDATPLANGPVATALAASTSQVITFRGLGAAIVDLTISGAATPSSTPAPTSTPSPTVAPTGTPGPSATATPQPTATSTARPSATDTPGATSTPRATSTTPASASPTASGGPPSASRTPVPSGSALAAPDGRGGGAPTPRTSFGPGVPPSAMPGAATPPVGAVSGGGAQREQGPRPNAAPGAPTRSTESVAAAAPVALTQHRGTTPQRFGMPELEPLVADVWRRVLGTSDDDLEVAALAIFISALALGTLTVARRLHATRVERHVDVVYPRS